MKKLVTLIALFAVTLSRSSAADTGILISVPEGMTGDAIITLDAPKSMDSYTFKLYKVGAWDAAWVFLFRSNPLQNMDWNPPNHACDPYFGMSSYVHEDTIWYGPWVWYVWGLPPGDYYVQYSGHGVLSTPDPGYSYGGAVGLATMLLAFWSDFRNDPIQGLVYGYIMGQGPYYNTISDASPAMNVTATYSVY